MTKTRKNAYPAHFSWAFARGREKELLTEAERKSIPRQTVSDWRKLSESTLKKLEEQIDIYEQVKMLVDKQELEQITRTRLFLAVARFQMRLIQQVGKKSYHRMLAYDKKAFIDLVRSYAEWIPLNQVLRLFQMNSRLFKSWVSQVSFSCESSSLSLCAKQHPFQITHQEYKVIESSLNDPVYAYWPKSAIHSDLLKKNLLTVSRSTYYKHAKLIQPESLKRDYRKPTYTPLRAERVNEIWHMDISQFRTRDDRRYYIYAIIDNYSRKILVWSCLDCISQIEIGNLISKALENRSGIRIRLISDAGTENVNKYIQKLLQRWRRMLTRHLRELEFNSSLIPDSS